MSDKWDYEKVARDALILPIRRDDPRFLEVAQCFRTPLYYSNRLTCAEAAHRVLAQASALHLRTIGRHLIHGEKRGMPPSMSGFIELYDREPNTEDFPLIVECYGDSIVLHPDHLVSYLRLKPEE